MPVIISAYDVQRSALCEGHQSQAIIPATATQVASATSSARDNDLSMLVTRSVARRYDTTANNIASRPGIAMNSQLDMPASIAKLRISGSMMAIASQQQMPNTSTMNSCSGMSVSG